MTVDYEALSSLDENEVLIRFFHLSVTKIVLDFSNESAIYTTTLVTD